MTTLNAMVIHRPVQFGRGMEELLRIVPGATPPLDHGSPKPGTVQRLYTAHVLETLHAETRDHVASETGHGYLGRCAALLAPGGVMRLVSVSINAPLSLLVPKHIDPGSRMHQYREWLRARAHPRAELTEHIVALGLYGTSHHRRSLWSAQMLRTKLLASGQFEDVYTESLNQSKYEELRNLEKEPPMPFEIYEYETFVIEAVKR